jgi:Ca2+-binding RTX toxin-like protein
MPGTTFVPATSNQDINGLLSGIRWNTASLTFSFPTSSSFYGGYSDGNGEPSNGFQPLNAVQQNAVRTILGSYSAVANLTFIEVTETASVHGDLRFAHSNAPWTAWAYYPDPSHVGGDSWYNFSSGSYANPVSGNYAWTTFLHEIGHALGLEHGHEGELYGAMTYAHDSMEYSVMTYRSYEGASTTSGYTNEYWGFAQTLMMYDIAALQHMYGANFNTNSGNTVYRWSPTNGEMLINGIGQGAPGANRIFETIWDGGGTDTYDFSNYSTNLTVSLRPGEWTTTSTTQLAPLHYSGSVVADGNIANALLFNGDVRSLIENANGGSGNDTITGNQVANYLWGNGGNDVLYGLEGGDTLYGWTGNDTLFGGAGIDYAYYLGARNDFVLIELVNGSCQLDDVRSSDLEGTDTLADIEYLIFQDGTFSLDSLLGVRPAATIADHGLRRNEWSQVENWVSYFDADADQAVLYQFWDSGAGATSGYFWTADNVYHAAETAITVAASNLDDVWLRGGTSAGTETMWVRAYDGRRWGIWDPFTFDTLPNTPPVATAGDLSLRANQWSQLTGLISFADADGEAAVRYEFWDSGTDASSGYFWTPSNPHHPANTSIVVSAAELSNLWLRGGQTPGSETMWVRAFDGNDWGAWDSFIFTTTPNTPPVATINDHSLRGNEWSQVDGWISYSDGDGHSAVQYQFWDSGTGATSGYFWTPDNHHHAADTPITVNAADIDDVWLRGGTAPGNETMWVRAFDGLDWGAWDSFIFTTVPNTAPVATINDHSLHTNEWSQVDGWISYSDGDGDSAVQYQFWDSGAGASSGYFWTPDNPHHAAETPITVNAADVDDVWVRGGTTPGNETMWVRAFDGTNWGAWDQLTLTTLV